MACGSVSKQISNIFSVFLNPFLLSYNFPECLQSKESTLICLGYLNDKTVLETVCASKSSRKTPGDKVEL